jgi:signal peptidase I
MGVGMDDVAHHRVGPFLIIRTFLVEAFRIPTGSMESTLQVGDFLLVNKAVYGARIPFARAQTPAVVAPERGDAVAFPPPHEPAGNNVKRLLGMPGATREMPDVVRFLNRRARSEGHVRFGDPVDVSSSCMSWQCEHAPAGAFADSCRPTRDSCRPTRDNRVPIAAFAADPSSSDMHSIPCPDALRDGSPVSGGAAPAMPCSDVSGLA